MDVVKASVYNSNRSGLSPLVRDGLARAWVTTPATPRADSVGRGDRPDGEWLSRPPPTDSENEEGSIPLEKAHVAGP